MSDPVLVLDFMMTVDEMRAEYGRLRRRTDHRVFTVLRIVFGAFLAWNGVLMWYRGGYWSWGGIPCVVYGIHLALGHRLLLWWTFRSWERSNQTFPMHLEIDRRSLLLRSTRQKFGNRFW